MSRSASLITTAIVLAFALSGCAGPVRSETTPPFETPPVEDFASAPSAPASGTSMGAQSFSYLEGTWAVTATPGEGGAASAADPSGDWELAVMGESMTVYIGEHRYEGILTGTEGSWSYTGMVTGANAQGEPLSGYIELTAIDTAGGAFTATLRQLLDADGADTATDSRWDISAVRR